MSPDIIPFETAVLVIGFIGNLLLGGGIVFATFTFMSRSVTAGAITGILMFGVAIAVQRWIGHAVITFTSYAQVETLVIVCTLGAALGMTTVFSVFEPQTPATMEANT